MTESNELLRRYEMERSEGVFAELVRRHIGLVDATALRQVREDASTAEDVTQAVFCDLAGQAKRLSRHPSVAGWRIIMDRRGTARRLAVLNS